MNYKLKILLFAVVLVWNTGIYPGFLISFNNDSSLILPLLNKFYSGVCHQQEYKLLEILGFKSMVCSRCAGIYAGVLISSFLLIFVKIKQNADIKYLLFSAIPLIIDIIFYHLNIYNYSKTIAFSTGLFFGSAGIYYFYVGLEKLISEYKLKEKF